MADKNAEAVVTKSMALYLHEALAVPAPEDK